MYNENSENLWRNFMQTILKSICEKELEKTYSHHLHYLLSSFFYDNKNKKTTKPEPYIISNYYTNIVVEIFNSFISKDFSVTKLSCDIGFIDEINNNALVGNFYEDIDIYHIKEKNINIIICDKETLFFIGSENLNKIIENNFYDICKTNKEKISEKDEIFEQIRDCNNLILLDTDFKINDTNDFNLNPSKKNYYTKNITYIFNQIYGESIKTKNYQNILEKYLLKAHNILSKDISEFYSENKDLFLKSCISIFIQKATVYLNEKDKQIIFNYLFNNSDIDKIIKVIFTFQYITKVYELSSKDQLNKELTTCHDFLDYSFIAVEMFKLVEIIFHNLLKDFWNKKNIIDKYGEFDISDDKLNLGKMEQFFKSKDPEICNHLNTKNRHFELLDEMLREWIDKTRNGFLHKHILPKTTLSKSLNDSINIACLLILTLIK